MKGHKHCEINGYIPPFAADDTDTPAWLRAFVEKLRAKYGGTMDGRPCIYAPLGRGRCRIHTERPRACRDYTVRKELRK